MLKDLKILDFTTLLPGPYASWMLAEMGAKVRKISAPNRPDLVLESMPKSDGGVSANRAWLNHAKEEVFLDLTEKESIDKIKSYLLEEDFNVVIEQFRPGVMAKFGLSYEEVKAIRPDIIYLSITGYGQQGPYSNRAGHDINFLALSGLMSYSGRKETGPTLNAMQIGDLAASQNAIIGLLAAHNRRKDTGQGAYIDVSMLDSLIPMHAMEGAGVLLDHHEAEREGNWLNGGSIYDFYETKDGGYLSVGSLEPKFWQVFCQTIGKPDWIEDGALSDKTLERKEELSQIILTKTRDEWLELFKDKDACVEPVLTAKEVLLHDENTKARQATKQITYRDEQFEVYANPIKFK